MKYGYVRVSTKEQNLSRQYDALAGYELKRVFADKKSGKNFDREAYTEMKSILQPGDEIYIKELDRLGRNKDAIKAEIEWFKSQGIILRILDIPTTLIDFKDQQWVSDMITNILVEVLGSIAEQEREKIGRRRDEGIAAMPIVNGKKVSMKTGRNYGRPAAEIPDAEKFLQKQKDGSMTVSEICAKLGISRSTWYAKVKEIA